MGPAETVFVAALAVGAGGMLMLALRKAPLLSSLSQERMRGMDEEGPARKVRSRVLSLLDVSPAYGFLARMLRAVKVFVMRVENRIDEYLRSLQSRRTSRGARREERENVYWDEVRKKEE